MDPSMMNQAPAAGAQPMDPTAGASAMPAQDPNAMMADPNAIAADPMAGGMDPNAGMDMGVNGDVDVEDILKNQIGLDGKELAAASGYIDYLKKNPYDSVLNNGEEADPNAMPAEDPNAAAQPMMESMVFSKKQLNEIQENLCNGVMDTQDKFDKPTAKKKDRKDTSKSPFGAKKFGNKQDI